MHPRSDEIWISSILFVGLPGLFFSAATVTAFFRAGRQRRLKNFGTDARFLFNDEEPEGEVTDRFPYQAKTPAATGNKPSGDDKTTQR